VRSVITNFTWAGGFPTVGGPGGKTPGRYPKVNRLWRKIPPFSAKDGGIIKEKRGPGNRIGALFPKKVGGRPIHARG